MSSTLTERFRFLSPVESREPFHVIGFHGVEGLHRLFDFHIDLVCADPDVDTGALLASPCRFEVARDDDAAPAVFSGYPAAVEQRGFFNGHVYYAVRLRPTFWKLSRVRQSAIFLNKKLEDVLRELMTSQPFFQFPHEFRLTDQGYPTPEFAMQYQESLYDYMCRRMEEQGAYFYFEEKDGADRVIFADAPQSHTADNAPRLAYAPTSGLEGDLREEVIVSLAMTRTPLPRRVVLRSYDWRNPNKPVVGMADVAPEGLGDVYLSNEFVDNDNDAGRLANIRAQELRCRSRLFHGASSAPILRPGRIFRLEGHYSAAFNRDYLVTEVTHEGRQDAFLSLGLGIPLRDPGDRLYYRNTFTCMEADVPYRPARTAPRNRIPGVLRAFVAGDGTGARAEMDEYGRYKLTFPFDISGRKGGNASCWIRRAQAQVGKDSGLGLPLLPGTEVLVSFVDGNPDLPVIGGALANGETGAISAAGNHEFLGLRTPGGNQITINDTDKKQGISLSTPAGGGLTISAGSTESATLQAAHLLQAGGVNLAQLGSFGLSQISGYKLNSGAYGYDMSFYLFSLFGALSSMGSSVMDSLSSVQFTGERGDELLDWSSTAVKVLSIILDTISNYKAAKGMTPLNYGVSLLAKDNEARSLLQIVPTCKELLSIVLPYFIGRGGNLVTDAVAVADETAASAPFYAYRAALAEAMHLLHSTDEESYAKYDFRGRQGYLAEPCESYVEVATDLATAAEQAATEEDRRKLKETAASLEDAWEKCCNEGAADADYFTSAKSSSVRNYIVDDVAALIPELLSLVLFWKGYNKTNILGGILLRADEANVTMTARDSIAMHSQRGILRNTRDLPRPDSPPAVPHVGKYAKSTTDALGKLENYMPGEGPKSIGMLAPFEKPLNSDTMATANFWGVEVQGNAHATDFMKEIDDLDWHIKDETTTQKGDYLRKRATFLADATELEFRRNRWSYQRSEEQARIRGDKELNLSGGTSGVTLRKPGPDNKVALLLATQDKDAQIVLRSQTSKNQPDCTQAIFSPSSLSLNCKPSNNKKPTARLDMKDSRAMMTVPGARLSLTKEKAVLVGKKSRIICSDNGIALEPGNGKVTLADIEFSGSKITGTKEGVLTLGNGAIKITQSMATIANQGDAPVNEAERFEEEQNNVFVENKIDTALLQAMVAEPGNG